MLRTITQGDSWQLLDAVVRWVEPRSTHAITDIFDPNRALAGLSRTAAVYHYESWTYRACGIDSGPASSTLYVGEALDARRRVEDLELGSVRDCMADEELFNIECTTTDVLRGLAAMQAVATVHYLPGWSKPALKALEATMISAHFQRYFLLPNYNAGGWEFTSTSARGTAWRVLRDLMDARDTELVGHRISSLSPVADELRRLLTHAR